MVKLGVAPGPDSLSLTDISCLSEISGKQRKSKRRMSEQKKSQSLEETVGEAARNGHNPPLSRSKTYDPSYSKEAEKEILASAQHRNSDSNLVKHTLNFRRVFKDFPEEEELLQTFSCAWQREVPYHGRLYISENHVCFYCSMVHREVKVVIPVPSISILKKANTALLVPNAVCIRTSDGEKFLFGSLRSRETVYQSLRSICKHLQDGSRNNSPTAAHNISDQLLKISLSPKELDSSRTPPLEETLPEETDGADRTRSPPMAAIEPHRAAANRGGSTKSWQSWKSHLSPLNTVIPLLGGGPTSFLGVHWLPHRATGRTVDLHGSVARNRPSAAPVQDTLSISQDVQANCCWSGNRKIGLPNVQVCSGHVQDSSDEI